MAQRHIQFYRNGAIYNDRAAALTQVESFKVNLLPSMKDGEMVLFRYNAPKEDKPNATGAIIGYVYNKNGVLDLYVIDIADLNVDEIEERIAEIEEEINSIKFVKKVEQVLKPNTSYTTSETDLYKVTSNDVTGGQETNETFQLMFTPVSPLALTVPQDIGDIKRGTTAEALSHESLSKILDDILFKTIYPTLTYPTFTASWSGYNANTIYPYGYTAPTEANVNKTYKNGTYIINDGVHTTPTTYTSTGVTYSYSGFGDTQLTDLGTKSYKVKPIYGEATSEQTIIDSKNNKAVRTSTATTVDDLTGSTPNHSNPDKGNANEAFETGLVRTLSLKVSLPFYIGVASNMVQQPMVAWGTNMITYYQMTAGTMTGDTALIIESPKQLVSIDAYNPLEKDYTIPWTNNFTMTTKQGRIIDSTGVTYPGTYYVYTWKGAAAGAEKIRIKTN